MRASEITEGPRDDIAAFSTAFDDSQIVTRVQTQAARKNPAWKKSATAAMAKYGFELIGAGINGAVFANPRYPYVLKLYREDHGFDEWLYFVRTNADNPYVPKIKGSPIRLNNVFKAIRIEPLIPAPTDRANSFIDLIQDIADSPWNTRKERNGGDDPHLVKIADFLRDWSPVNDLSAHNVMMRQNGELVVIDPIYIEPGQEIDW